MALDRVPGAVPNVAPIARARLPPAGVGARALAPGQVLTIRVVGQAPHLELVLHEGTGEGAAGDDSHPLAPAHPLEEPPAVQPDQAAMRRLMGAGPDAATLAATWRAMALERLRRAAIVAETPLLAPPAGADPAGKGDEAGAVFRTSVWPGVPLHFWLLWDDEPEPRPAPRPPAGPAAARLRLGLFLAELGQITIDVDLRGDTVGLVLLTANPPMAPAVRGRVGLIAARMAHAGLRLMRCRVEHGIAYEPAGEQAALPALPAAALAGALPEGLFRAAAEAVAALSLPFR